MLREFSLGSISLVDVHYTYPGSTKSVLNGINIDIPVGSRIAFVGPSGRKLLRQLLLFVVLGRYSFLRWYSSFRYEIWHGTNAVR